MKSDVLFVAILLLCPNLAGSQTGETTPTAIDKEPHHSLVFENDRVRVFHLQLQPNEATKRIGTPRFTSTSRYSR